MSEEKIFIKNSANLKLSAIVNTPTSQSNFPLVIILVGFGGYKEWLPMDMLASDLAKNGIGSIRFDPSGFGESDGKIKKDYRVSNYIKDSQSIFDFVKNIKGVDKKRFGILGHSMGGILAGILANKNQDSINALSIVSSRTVMAGDEELRGKYKKWKETGQIERSNSKYGKFYVPFSFLEDAMKFDLLNYLKPLKIPLLVGWCLEDKNVPVAMTKNIYESYEGSKEFFEIEGSDHYLNRDPKTIQIMVDKVVDFMLRKL